MEFVLFYELKERELQNAYLLKAELNRRGHTLHICEPFRMYHFTKEKIDFTPDAVITPYLYETRHLELFKSLFKTKIKRIVNLQYEQIVSKNHYDTGLMFPKGLCKNAIHLCWNETWRKLLIENRIPEKNAVLSGSLNVDMDLDRFSSLYKTKSELAKEYRLDGSKKWILLLSNFVMANLNEDRKKFYSSKLGENAVVDRMKVTTDSRDIALKWIKKYITENECEFIYRPHPAESVDDILCDMEEKYNNFHIIRQDSVRTWIKASEKMSTFYSTSIIDAYFMKKECCVLRPIDLPDFMYTDLYKDCKYIRSYDEFLDFNNSDKNEFPIPKESIYNIFYVDKNRYSYEIVCDLLEYIVNNNIEMEFYNN